MAIATAPQPKAARNPDVIITGTLVNLWNVQQVPNPDLAATIEFALCGYGSQIPRVAGEALFSTATAIRMGTQNGQPGQGSAGGFEIMLYSNDTIEPAGTYYTATIRNGNGDILQVNAYRFTVDMDADLSTLTPYDPNQPPPPLPPLITNQLLVMPWAADMQFPGDQYLSFRLTLSGDVTSSELINYEPGNLYTWIIQQDAVGGHAFTWPTNSRNMTVVNPAPDGVTVQTAVMGTTYLRSIGPSTWYML